MRIIKLAFNQVSQQFQHIMAFVYRAERKTDQVKNNIAAGPGSYQLEVQKQSKMPKAFVPFGTMQTKSKDNTYKLSALPGPGSYNIAENQNGQKIVVSSETQDIKILQISRPHPVFKSGTQRFAIVKQQDINPGPGQYNVSHNNINTRPKMLSTNTTSSKPKIIQHLININKYQSIPSIPSNIHAYGYNENESNQLQLNQPPIQVYKGEKQDKVGPGHYQITAKQRVKGTSCWSQAKQKRWDDPKSNLNIGPGSYDIKSVQSLYNYKPTSNFASKTLRTMDQRKGAIIQQFAKKNQKIIEDNASSNNGSQLESRVFSQKNPPSTMIDDESDEQYEYIYDTTPGPGSYLEISEVKKFNKPSRPAAPCFGVGTKRFVKSTYQGSNIVGPGSYNPNIDIRKIRSKTKNIIPPKDAPRFPELVNTKKVEQPGPGAYQPRNTMEDKLIYKIQRGYRGQFGSTEVRSKDVQDNQQPGPGQYDPQLINQQKQILSVFKSSTKRKDIANLNNVPAPGVYSINNYDISTRVIKQEQDDPDLVIKKPGFGVGQKRFKDAPLRQQEFDDDDIIKQIQDKYRQQKKRKLLKNSAAFKSGEPRLKGPRNQIPGPGSYYDGQEDHWNKRTYNILFADI